MTTGYSTVCSIRPPSRKAENCPALLGKVDGGFIEEMDKDYRDLRNILDDPNGSLYLNEGMYKKGIQFLEDQMAANGGEGSLYILDDRDSALGYYLSAVLGHLEPAVNANSLQTFHDGMDAVKCMMADGMREAVHGSFMVASMLTSSAKQLGGNKYKGYDGGGARGNGGKRGNGAKRGTLHLKLRGVNLVREEVGH